jgi:alkaline phosphatase D
VSAFYTLAGGLIMVGTPKIALDRRDALKGLVAAGVGTLSAGAVAAAERNQPTWSFLHGVASGDPTASAVVIWTRVTPTQAGGAVTGTWEAAEDEGFTRPLRSGAFASGPERDYTVKIDVTDLTPGRRFYYRFRTGNATSPVGRAMTLPVGATPRLRVALFSCSNYGFGYFNAYRHCAERDDIDLALHVGDYIYEYGPGRYGDPAMEKGPRRSVPETEIVTLADYRARHALYRTDPDLQAVHQRLPFIVVWDDHEITNDAWLEGAENHQPNEGPWGPRRDAAVRAYFEWMPIRPLTPDAGGRTYRSFDFGDLASIIMLDTRIYGRDRPLRYETDIPMVQSAGAPIELIPVSDTKAAPAGEGAPRPDWDRLREMLADPSRSMLGAEQEAWLAAEFKRTQTRGQTWRIVGQQTLLGLMSPFDPAPFLGDSPLTDAQRTLVGLMTNVARERLPIFLDSFGGSYQAARERLLDAAAKTGGNTVILTGDSHNAFAFNLKGSNGDIVAVEIGATSVTSPGLEADLPIPPRVGEKELISKNPELVYCNLSDRGYSVLNIEPQAITAEWIFIDTVTSKNFKAVVGKRLQIAHSDRGTAPFSDI